MTRSFPLRGLTLLLLTAMTTALNAQQESTNAHARPAHFRVSAETITSPVQPFTATVSAFGNSQIHSGGAFEPIIMRNRFTALQDSPDRIVIAPELLSRYDTLREGFYDDAELLVYRIENGKFRLVRRDKVAPGGSHQSGWIRVLGEGQFVAPDTASYTFRWDDWNRSGVPYYFTVRAIDKQGRLSPPATAIRVDRQKTQTRPVPVNTLVQTGLKPSSTPSLFSPPAPANLRARHNDGGTVQLDWDPVTSSALAGYAVFRSDYAPEQQNGHFLQLNKADPSNPIRAGDMVMVHKKFYATSRSTLLSNRVWGAESEFRQILPGLVQFFSDEQPGKYWQLLKHERDGPVKDGGETYLQLQIDGGNREALSLYNYSGTAQNHYDVLESRTYRVEVWLRQEGKGSVRFALSGFYGDGLQAIQPIEFRPGREWKKFTATFKPSVLYTGDQPGQMLLEFSGPGKFSVDNFRVYRADTGYLEFLPEEAQAIRASAMQALRTHGPVKTGTRTYDMVQFTNPGGVIEGIRKGNTLPQMLTAFQKTGVRPWLQIEYHMAPEEWLGLIEYLAAPYAPDQDSEKTKPWAHKRHVQGRTKPWLADFDKVYLELGNETWNRLFRPWIFEPMTDSATGRSYTPGQVYGLYQEYVIATLKSSPWWRSAELDGKFEFVLSGHAANARYGRDAAISSPTSAHLAMGAYIGGWDESEGPPPLTPRSLFYVLNQISQSGGPAAQQLLQATQELSAARPHPVFPGTYEAGPGYAMNGLNGARVTAEQAAEQERVMKSVAAGTATLDAFLSRAQMGFRLQNYFTFGSGPRWTSHTRWHEGGKPHPAWELLSLFNREATGAMVRVDTISVPTTEIDAIGRRKAVSGAPLIAAYALRTKKGYALALVSRKVAGYPIPNDPGFTPVIVDLPFKRAQSVTLFRLNGNAEDSRSTNKNPEITKVMLPPLINSDRLTVGAAAGASFPGLPPGVTYLYIFENVDNVH